MIKEHQPSSNTLRAVIDLGTNTFHLLIARISPAKGIEEVYRERIFVKLASDGISTIGPRPFERGMMAIIHFRKILDEYKCQHVSAIGTAALRRATNGQDFIKAVFEQSGLTISLISGDEEARLITNGVLAAIPNVRERMLIMDIGGGSTEFIIVDKQQVLWRQSFPIGISVLKENFHHNDPIGDAEKHRLYDHLRLITAPLTRALAEFPTHHLAGAAGTFELLANLLIDNTVPQHPTYTQIALDDLPQLAKQLINTTVAERERLPYIPQNRVDMVVVAMLLITFTLELASISRITVSKYALKEGVLLDV